MFQITKEIGVHTYSYAVIEFKAAEHLVNISRMVETVSFYHHLEGLCNERTKQCVNRQTNQYVKLFQILKWNCTFNID